MKKAEGKIVIEPGRNVWPHELKTARAIAASGFDVVLVADTNLDYQRNADALIDHDLWEFKSPKSDKVRKVQKTIRQALHQSCNIVYDSQRIRGLTDRQIERELCLLAKSFKSLKRLWFINRRRELKVIK